MAVLAGAPSGVAKAMRQPALPRGSEALTNGTDIDAEWEEAPVSFNESAAHEMGGPTGVVAKIRASNRPVNESLDQEAAR